MGSIQSSSSSSNNLIFDVSEPYIDIKSSAKNEYITRCNVIRVKMKGSQFIPFIEHRGLIYMNESGKIILVCQFPPVELIQKGNIYDAIDAIIHKASARYNDDDYLEESFSLENPVKVEFIGRVAKNFDAKTYNVLANNCQTFVNYMLTNIPLRGYKD